jgi:hypothetical protein
VSGHPKAVTPLEAHDLTLPLLAALSHLTPTQREAWVDRYVLGRPLSSTRRQYVMNANRKLAGLLEPVLAR